MLIMLLVTVLASPAFAQLRITCFDIGQGNGAYLQAPSGKNAVIDAGPSNTAGRLMWKFIRDSMAVRHLDYTFLSHYHLDHIDGMDKIIDSVNIYPDSFRVGAYDRGYSYTTAAYDEYVASAGAKRNTATIGQLFDFGSGVTAQCISVNGKTLSGDSILPGTEENNKSFGLLITYGTFKMVFATDIAGYNSSSYKDVESILAPDIGPVSVMIVNHHGSATSSNPAWVSTLNPQASIISIGENNTYSHPSQDAIDRLCNNSGTYIYQTENSPLGGGTIPAGRGRVTNSNIHIIVGDTSFTVDGDHYSLPAQGVETNLVTTTPQLEVGTPFPNPSRGLTTLTYQLPQASDVNIRIYNVAGQLLKHLFTGAQQPGKYSVRWDGRDEAGGKVPTGIYMCRFSVGTLTRTMKVILVR